jgi:hypothetical protein
MKADELLEEQRFERSELKEQSFKQVSLRISLRSRDLDMA